MRTPGVAVATALLLAAAASAADLPLVASRLVTGPNSHVELRNTSAQPITAWTIVVSTVEKDGRARRAVETVDAYLSEVTREFAGASDTVDRLMAGQSREIDLAPVSPGSTVDVAAVVFQDGTAMGNRMAVAAIFEQRARERDQLREVSDIFSAVLPAARGIEALEALEQRLAPQAGRETAPRRAAREAVDAYLQRATAATADALDQLIRKYADIVRREYELAEQHSHFKTSQ